MKKFLILLFISCVLLLISIYIFIPGNLEISKITPTECSVNGAFRILSDQRVWGKWWPKKDSLKSKKQNFGQSSFFYNEYNYCLSKQFFNVINVSMQHDNTSIESEISIIQINSDSVFLMWKCQLPTSLNPIKRILDYKRAEDIRNNMTDILYSLRVFLEKEKNIYGINPQIIMSKDSTMVATKGITTAYPSTSYIYDLIGTLKKYVAHQGAKENNFPMLHVKKINDSTFETMIAIPVNRQLEGNGKIFFSRFVPWKMLTAEVRGGNQKVEQALDQMKIYISDYQKTAMAIPYQSLVTDRSKEPDTLKWITRINTPVPN